MKKMRNSLDSKIFDTANVLLMLGIMFVTLYPFLYVASASLSNYGFVARGDVVFFPKGFTLEAYQMVFRDPFIWLGYWNTIRYTVAQTVVTLFFTAMMAYPLSKDRVLFKRAILLFVGFTLMFRPGMIPRFLVIKYLGLYDNFWALIAPGVVNAFYLFIMRTFFMTIPQDLDDAATIDGCGPLATLLRIVLPLSMPVMVTVGLFTAVNQWNAYFHALIFLASKSLYPLQIFLRNIVISGSAAALTEAGAAAGDVVVLETVKYATIIVAVLPIICVYPFVQKYFVRGALIGGVKG